MWRIKINIFILDYDPVKAAQYQCDKHVVKMAVESAQMLSTAHRVLDGKKERRLSKSGKRMIDYWVLPDEREELLMKVAHVNHPCNIWTRLSSEKYEWHLKHFRALLDEYTFRYGKIRATEDYYKHLEKLPDNIPPSMEYISEGSEYHPFAVAIGDNNDCIVPGQIDQTYRNFYFTKRNRFKMNWTMRQKPDWFKEMELQHEYCD